MVPLKPPIETVQDPNLRTLIGHYHIHWLVTAPRAESRAYNPVAGSSEGDQHRVGLAVESDGFVDCLDAAPGHTRLHSATPQLRPADVVFRRRRVPPPHGVLRHRATGYIGGHVARQLVDDGHEVIALARTPSNADDLHDLGATVVEGDITEKASLREPMAGVDGVFHIAGWCDVGVTDPGERINVDGTRNVLAVMDELDVPKGVYTSTFAVNSDTGGRVVDEEYVYAGPHLTAYDRTKWQAHYEVAAPMVEAGLPEQPPGLPGVAPPLGGRSDASFERRFLENARLEGPLQAGRENGPQLLATVRRENTASSSIALSTRLWSRRSTSRSSLLISQAESLRPRSSLPSPRRSRSKKSLGSWWATNRMWSFSSSTSTVHSGYDSSAVQRPSNTPSNPS